MTLKILVPHLPESVSDATLVAWHKKVGDSVIKNDSLVDLETDKVTLEVVAPESGILQEILKQDGAIVLGGDVLAILKPSDVGVEISPVLDDNDDLDNPLTPSIRRLLREHELNAADIAGTGKDGRLTKLDVSNYIQQRTLQEAQVIVPKQPVIEEPINEIELTTPAINLRPEQRVPMTRLRAKVAERLLQAQQNAAMLTTFNEVNMQNVMDLRNQYKTRFEQKHSVKLGFMSFFVKASIEALKRFPVINASIDENDIIYHGYYDIGIAVSTEKGLIVPVLRDADQLDFAGIEQSIVEFGEKTRSGRLSYDDLKGGTFTITNGGIFGSMLSTPILNPPQSAILGMHAIKERAVVENGQIVIRPIMYLALSYDHRLIDGRDAVQFLVTIKECLESPAHLLLNI
ncbi:MAG: 2-oxoglutarate dehydrogenase complex dihydrolipoyllysine-residue succinyltransferase [Methylococcales bacterium]|jgi:2-oxoglutarate dehydrogenase E2 component (dihydrolipoamide succinyltransferase)|nr:2-oxoglutarate dehydrogenase complex dihydrolipoyllysine-residue succinyltransferase [Methylococcales bacterium]MCX7075782.1 2-oxoglutarate dehydrogenase complex dihydrolipoyllysine-residue succinyltransferase [Methylococcales bacterium]